MKIDNEKDLKIASIEAGNILQRSQDYLTSNNSARVEIDVAKVRFPRGFIRTTQFHKRRLHFINNNNLKRNISYTIILSDTILWLLNRTDIAGIAKEMLYKFQIFIIGTITESLTKEYLKNRCGQNFKKRTEYLVNHNIISIDLKINLDLIWNLRNNMHLFMLDKSEYSNDYNKLNHMKYVSGFHELLSSLNKHKFKS